MITIWLYRAEVLAHAC